MGTRVTGNITLERNMQAERVEWEVTGLGNDGSCNWRQSWGTVGQTQIEYIGLGAYLNTNC